MLIFPTYFLRGVQCPRAERAVWRSWSNVLGRISPVSQISNHLTEYASVVTKQHFCLKLNLVRLESWERRRPVYSTYDAGVELKCVISTDLVIRQVSMPLPFP